MYILEFTRTAEETIKKLKEEWATNFCQAKQVAGRINESPATGTGHPEQLKGEGHGQWSRRITKKHRLVYQIKDIEVVVLVLSAYGHYDDK